MPKAHSNGFKRRLYRRVSAAVLLAAAGFAGGAEAADQNSGSGFWLLLAGGYNFDSGGGLDSFPSDTLAGPMRVRPKADWDIDGAIGYNVPNSPWVVDVGVKYGRTFRRSRSFSGSTPTEFGTYTQKVQASTNVTHTVVDFEVGREFGVGSHTPTTVGLGVRYARFDAQTRGTFSTSSKYTFSAGSLAINRVSNLVGPRIFVRSDVPLGGGGFSLGWGGGAAVLFGTENSDSTASFTTGQNSVFFHHGTSDTVPNVGAYATLNYHAPNTPATIFLGYRVDAFFNAMEGSAFGNPGRRVDVIEHGPVVGFVWNIR